jgi:hypothetical protein
MSKSLKIKKYLTLTLCLLFSSWTAIAHSVYTNDSKSNKDSIPNNKNSKAVAITVACFTGNVSWSDPKWGLGKPVERYGSITYIDRNGNTVTEDGFWSEDTVTIAYQSIITRINSRLCTVQPPQPSQPTITHTSGVGINNCVNIPMPTITYATTGVTSVTFTTLPPGITGSFASGVVTISGTSTAAGYFPYVIYVTGDGGINQTPGQMSFGETNTVSAPSDSPNVCINTALTAITHTTTGASGIGTPIGLPSGVTATWNANTITISGTPNATGMFYYSIPLIGGCGAVNATGTIAVSPSNSISLSSVGGTDSQTRCIFNAITPIAYNTSGATGATISGLPGGVSGSWSSNVVTISGTPNISGTFYYTVSLTGGCGGGAIGGVIYVKPDSTIIQTSPVGTESQTICVSNAITPITYNMTGITDVAIGGLPNGISASFISNVLTISGTPTTSGTFRYTSVLTAECNRLALGGMIYVTANKTASAASSAPTLCINTALTAITHTTVGATGIGAATGLPAGVSASFATNTITISGTPTAAGTFNYSIPLTGGCGTVNATGTITVTANKTASAASSAPTLCNNTALTAITHTTVNATGIGTATGLPAGVSASFATNTITISGTPTAAGTFNYSIPLTGGCGTVNATGTITVTANKTASAASSAPTLCNNTALTAITHTTVAATGIGTATGLPAGVTAAWAANTITISGTPTASGTFAYSIPLTGGCGTVNATGTITVTANKTASAASSTPTLCINTALTAITHTTVAATGIGTATGLPAGVTAAWAANTITISGTPTASGTFAYSIPLTGGCGTVNATGTITVTANKTASAASSAPTLCINTALTAITHTTVAATGIGTATGLPAGVTAAWAANTITISGTPTASGTFAYSIPLTGGCGTVNATGTITVMPNKTSNTASTSVTLCINTALTAITHTTTGATGIGTATGLPTGITATWTANTITISGTPTASGTFNYNIPLTGGCGSVNATGTIIVVPNRTVSAASASPTLCINTALTAFTHTTAGATGILLQTGLPSGVTAAWAANTITISGTPTASGTFNYSIVLAGGCEPANATGTIIVIPNKTASAASYSPTLCINSGLFVTHTTVGATAIGTATGLPAGVTATWAANTITISGTPTASGTFNYTIPLTGGCGTTNATGTIIVTPANTASVASASPTLCISTALTAITHTTVGATGIGAATGLPAGVTAAWAANTITISGTPTASGTFNYSIPLTGGCGTVNATGTITVTANKTASAASSTPTLCINTALTAITHTTVAATGIGTATGLPAGVTAAWAANTITISGTPTASGTFAYSIPLTGGCGTVNATGTITVTANKTASAASSAPTLCINTALTAITHTTVAATGIGTATGLPAGVTAAWAANTITISGTPTASGTFAYSIPLTGGCGTVNATGTITVTANKTASAASSTPTLCINTALTAITHTTVAATGIGTATGLPAGVTAAWAANTITISGTPTASGTFAYSIPLTGGCGTVNATGTITVTANKTASAASSAPTLCINTALTAITHTTVAATGIGTATGLPAGVTAAWAANTITISGTPTASGTFAYSIPLTGGCGTVNATGTITVTANKTASAPSSAPTLCINTTLTAITHTTVNATGIGTATGLPSGVSASFATNTITISGTPTAAGTFNYSIPLTGGCGAVNAIGTIIVTPANTVALSSAVGTDAQTRCLATVITPITYATTGATGATVTGLPTGVSGSWAANVVTISGTPTASGTFNYIVTLTGGCGIVTKTGSVIVTPNNTASAASSAPTLCINTALTAITHTTVGATAIGTPVGLPTGVSASFATNTITISGTPTASGTFAYSIPLTGGCGAVNATGTIIVTPANTVALSSAVGTDAQTRCLATAITPITYATTGATGATYSGLPTGVSGSWTANVVTISGTPTVSGTFNYTVTLTGGCGAVTKTGSVIVTPNNTASAASSAPTLCINTALTAITHTTVGATAIGTPVGLPTGVSASFAANTITISGTPTAAGTFNYSIPLTGGCGAVNATGTIIVTPANTVALSSTVGTDAQTRCLATAITPITYATTGATGATYSGLPTGVSGSWTANVVTISGTPTVSGTFNYTVTLTGGCGAVTKTGSVIVTPNNTASTASSAPTLCINTALTAITHTTVGATAIGTPVGLPTGVSASFATNTITISGTPTASGTFNYSIPLTGGCGAVNATGTITVTANKTASAASSAPTLCINTALTAITHTTVGATAIGTPVGLPTGVSASFATNTITISGTPTTAGTFNYSIPLTGGCGAVNAIGTIIVTPANTVALSSAVGTDAQTRCLATAITPITYATTGATGATVTGLPTGVSGSWAANVVTISGTPTVSGTFNYTVTLTGGCGAVTKTGSIIVTPNNTASAASSAPTLCINTALTAITHTTVGATAIGTPVGLPTGVSASFAANTITISGTPTTAGTFNYSIPLTGGCGAVNAIGTIIVTPANTVALSSAVGTDAQTRCLATAITPITYATTGATGATVTGLPTGVSGSWAANVVTISGTPTASGTFNYTVTLTGGCGAVTKTGSIIVTPNNTASAASSAPTLCINTALTAITHTTVGATAIGTPVGLPTGVSASFAANTITISGTPTAAGTFNYSIPLTGGCGVVNATGTIIVTPANTVALSSAVGTDAQTRCLATAITPITYTTTGATGATYSGLPTGVSGSWTANVVTISGTPTASGTFNYTVTLTGGCGAVTKTGSVIVTPNNTASAASSAPTLCINTTLTAITHTTVNATGIGTPVGLPTGVSASFATNTITISGTPTAAGTFNYSIPLTGGCGAVNATGTIIVTPANTVALSSAVGTDAQTKCLATAITPITYATTGATGATYSGLPTGVSGSWTANVVTISGTSTASGTFNYTVTLTGGCGAVNATGTIIVTPANTVALSSAVGTDAQTKCLATAITPITYATTGATGATYSGLPTGVSGSWTANVVTISGTPTVSGTFNYTVTLTGGCGAVTKTGSVIVTPNNTASAASSAPTLCINTALTAITHTTVGATAIGTPVGLPTGVSASFATNTITISGTPTTAGTFNYSIPLTGGCGAVNAIGTIIVTPANTVALSSAVGTDAQTRCLATAITPITYATTGATGATVTGLPTGVSGSWAANVVTISGTPTVSGTFNYTVTLTGGCGAVTKTGSIIVTPNNTASAASSAPTLCINTALTAITHTTVGATAIGTPVGLPTGVSASFAANTITISGTPTTAGTFNYSIPLTGGCGAVNAIGTIIVTPANTVALSSAVGTDAQTRCLATAITPITYATTGATGATVTGLPTGVSGSWAANVVTISGTPTASGTFNYTVTLTGGCGAVTKTGSIIVTPNNTASAASSAPTLCINTALTAITHTTVGATAIGTPVGLPTGVSASFAANTITISGTPTAAGTFNYSIPLTGGCGVVNATGTIIVTPANTVALSSAVGTDAQTRCLATAITPITYTTTGATGATYSGLPTGVSGSWTANVVTISGTPTVSGTFNYTVTLTGGCGAVTKTGSVIVTPNNTASAASSAPTLCINTTLTAITHTTVNATGIGTPVGLPTGVSASFATNTITISGTPTAAGTFNYSIPLTGGCGAVNATGTIIVTPANTVALSSAVGTDAQTKCLATAITPITYATTGATGATYSGLPTGVSGSWTANVVTISGTSTASGTFNYTVTLTGGCGAVTKTGSVIVTPNNTASTASSAPTLCINTALTAITHTTVGATGIGTATGLPVGVSASFATNTITISGTPTAAGTFNYSIPLTGGCGAVNATGTIIVTPANTVALSSAVGTDAQTRCLATAITPITYATTGATGATVTGLPTGISGSWTANVVTISGTPTASGTFNYTVTLTGGCGAVTKTGSVIVTPNNTASAASSAPTLCINTALTAITHTTVGATGIGTATGLPAGVSASFAANTITISGTPTAAGTFNYSIPLTGGCGAVNATGNIIVTPNKTTSAASSAPTLCINTALTAITHTTVAATGIGIATGLPAGVSASFVTNTITISGTPTASGTFNYSIPLTGGCGAVNATGIIIVTPNKTASAASSAPTLCINTALTAITHTTVGATAIGTPVGLPTGVSASFATNTITISGTPTASGTFNYSIPLTGGCGAVNATGIIIVTPNKTASAASSAPTLCINTTLTAITHTTVGATAIGTPVGLPTGVSASFAANTITISGTPTASGTFNYSIPLTGGCGAVNATGTIIVTPANTVALSSAVGTDAQTRCLATAITPITYATTGATGATVTGLPTGVSGSWTANVVTISGTPTVSGTFNYTVTLTGGCGAVTKTGSVIVTPNNTASAASSAPTLCINTALTAITHTTVGATAIGTPVGLPTGVSASFAANTITISGTPTAAGTFNYSIPLTGGCGAVNATGTIIVTPANTVALSSTVGTDAQTRCLATAITPITYTTTGATGATYSGLPTGVSGSWTANVVTISGTPTASGTFNYTVTLTGGCGAVTKTGSVIVTPNNSITLSSEAGTDNQSKNINVAITPITYVTDGATNATITGLPSGVTGSFSNNIITITGAPTDSGTFNYSINLIGGCGIITATGTITTLCKPITGIIKIIKTPSTSYSFQFSNPGNTSVLACEEVAFPVKLYAGTATLDINTPLYLNESLTIPVANGNLWYQYQENATSYKIDNTGKITETYSCSTSVCDKRYLTDVTITAPQGSVIDFSYFLPNGTQVTDRFTASSNGGEQIYHFPVLNCISESAWGVDGDTSTVTPNWNDNIECCVVIPTGYEFRFSNPGRTSSSLACAQTSFTNKFYAATSTLGIGTQLYTSASLTTPVGSGNLWYQLGIDGISYRIDNTGKVAEIIPCGEEPSVQTYLFRAVHPEGHSGSDYVTYIDADGVQQKYTFPRSPDSNPAPCEQIEARSIILEIGVVPCTE